jgi:hypothetical protein
MSNVCVPVAVALLLAWGPGAEGAVSSNDSQQLESASMNQGGGNVSSSGFRQRSSIGEAIAGHRISSTSFRIAPGFLGASATGTPDVPVAELALQGLTAKTDPGAFGQTITAATWQADRDPVFYWEPPLTGAEVAGYSYALDAAPDATIETIATSVHVATLSPAFLSDGRHTFAVLAVNSAGNVGEALTFEIWVDTTAPVILGYTPATGALLNTLSPVFHVELSDTSSGLTSDTVTLTINGDVVPIQWDPATGTLTFSGAAPWQEGVNSLSLTAADAVGNAAAPVVWSLTIDVTAPTGTVVINGGAAATASAYVTLSLAAEDAQTGVTRMQISNEAAAGFVEEPFVALRELWLLTPVRGTRQVYVRFFDQAGNASATVSDTIFLDLQAPETLLTDGPASLSAEPSATFTFTCSEPPCVYAWAFDGEAWSAWSEAMTATRSGFSSGNHYFRVKAAKDTNGRSGIQEDEEDPSPAERTWVVGHETRLTVPKGPPVKLWRVE